MELSTHLMRMEIRPPIGWMIFDNPERHNALALEMWETIPSIIEVFENDPEVRVIALRGAGRHAFISGADISEFERQRSGGDGSAHYEQVAGQANASVQDASKPTIAAIRGYCIGGGLGMALNCDLRLASESSRFGIPAAKLGVGYHHAGLARLIALVGPAFAKEIFFTARQFDAHEALAMGLVNRVLPDDELDDFIADYCRRIAANAPLTLRSVKVIVGELSKGDSTTNLDLCREVVRDCFESADYVEGRRAFMEKRKPRFEGR